MSLPNDEFDRLEPGQLAVVDGFINELECGELDQVIQTQNRYESRRELLRHVSNVALGGFAAIGMAVGGYVIYVNFTNPLDFPH